MDPLLEGIAIVGVSGRFPGAENPEAFWRNLVAGVESISTFKDDEMAAAGLDLAAVDRDRPFGRPVEPGKLPVRSS